MQDRQIFVRTCKSDVADSQLKEYKALHIDLVDAESYVRTKNQNG